MARGSITVTQPSLITLTVTAPLDGDAVYRPDVQVTGTVAHRQGLETGVVVNGVIALVYDGQFVANHVPLQGGSNTIIVRATDANGEFKEETFYLTSDTPDPHVSLNVDIEMSLAPFKATLKLDSGFNLLPSKQIHQQGVTLVDLQVGQEQDTWEIILTEPGIYYFTIDVQDEAGTYYNDAVAVLAMDRAVLDALLQAKWSGMKDFLTVGDIARAVEFHHPFVKKEYETIYMALGDKLPALIKQMQDIMNLPQFNGHF